MTSHSSNLWKWQEDKVSTCVSSFFTADGRQKVPRRWREERKKWGGGGWKKGSDFQQKSVWRFPVSWQSDGQLNVTCETCFPSFLICRSKCFNNQQGAYKMFIVPAKSLQNFFIFFTCLTAPRFPCSGGMMSSAKTQNRRAFIFCSHL